MKAVNQSLEPHEQICKIVVTRDTWSIDNGLMTPTMKVKRNEVESRYGQLITQHAENRDKIGWQA